jgi:diadenosine tetraphosphate (Ap4A) HIT family hydrolase
MQIHPNLASKTLIIELKNTFVLLEDNSHFPWIILAYKKNVKNMLELTTNERCELMKEIEICEKMMNKIYNSFQTNIAIFGNKTPWLHIHIIARQENDANFPQTPFEIQPKPYTDKEKFCQVERIKKYLKKVLAF